MSSGASNYFLMSHIVNAQVREQVQVDWNIFPQGAHSGGNAFVGGLDFYKKTSKEAPPASIQPLLQHQWGMCPSIQKQERDLRRGDAETSTMV